MWRPRTSNTTRALAAATAFGALLAGCSDLYYDRRETIALGADDAVAANLVAQMVDPWPAHSNNKNLAFNGERMQRAVECYRDNKVTTPSDLNTSSASYLLAGQPAQTTKCTGGSNSGSASPALGTAVK
jgi:hypothetical protein